jgi:hypothetical protein
MGVNISGMAGERGRAELDLTCSQPFGQDHRAAAERAAPEGRRHAGRVSPGRHGIERGRCASGKQLFAKWDQSAPATACQEAEVTYADETTWQHMQQEATQELIDGQSQKSLLVLMSRIPPAKGNPAILESNETAIGNRHPMRVGAEVAKHLFGPAECWFAIDNPTRNIELADKAPKELGLGQATEQTVELELSGGMRLLDGFDEFAAEDLTKSPYREEEPVFSWVHPVAVVPGQSPGGDNAVNMRVVLQFLVPGMEDAEKANLGAEVLGIRSNFDQGIGAATKQQAVDHVFVLQGQRRQLMREGEDNMGIGCGE